jgi:hypothetical protein
LVDDGPHAKPPSSSGIDGNFPALKWIIRKVLMIVMKTGMRISSRVRDEASGDENAGQGGDRSDSGLSADILAL